MRGLFLFTAGFFLVLEAPAVAGVLLMLAAVC